MSRFGHINHEVQRRILEAIGETEPAPMVEVDPDEERKSEKAFQAEVVAYAERHCWRIYHTYNSRHSEKGYPDLCMVRGNRLIYAELKSSAGKLKAEQSNWLEDLRGVGGPVEVYVWRPEDWPEIMEALR